ncbi:MAG: DUF1573 domain-containing protein [Bacteroidales bacterium]|nr:DUF1573 domain-containing protein [Bacteroidales bacterium]
MNNKILFITGLILIVLISCKQSSNDDKEKISTEIVQNPITASGDYNMEDLPEIKFEKNIHDFGVIIQGEKVSHTFTYKNAGKSDLIIRSARASCGCTVPKFSKEPLAPGDEAEIEVIFNSSGRKGSQHKTITILTNAQPNKTILKITCEIVIPN